MEAYLLKDRIDFLRIAQARDPFLVEKISQLPPQSQRALMASIPEIPGRLKPEAERLVVENIRERVEKLIGIPVLTTRFDEALKGLPGAELYAPEDTLIALEATEAALRRCRAEKDGPITLVDLCTGTSAIPLHFLLQEKIQGFWACDIDPRAAEQVQRELLGRRGDIKRLLENHTRTVRFDVMDDDLEPVAEVLKKESARRVLSANPPWVPAPENPPLYPNSTALYGGVDGLQFLEPIFQWAKALDAERVCVNVGSIADMNRLLGMLQAYDYEIEEVQALETYSYGFDAMRETQDHFKQKISGSRWRRDRVSKTIRYLILGLTLKKSSQQPSVRQSTEQLRVMLEGYSKRSRNKSAHLRRMAEASGGFLKLWTLNQSDEKRIRTFKDPLSWG